MHKLIETGNFVLHTDARDRKMLKLFEYVATALMEGSGKRPPLSRSLVRGIFFAGGFNLPSRDFNVQTEAKFSITGRDDIVRRACWMVTGPFTSDFLSKVASVRLTTISRHQRRLRSRESGSQSWFELAIISQAEGGEDTNSHQVKEEHIRRRSDGTLLTWTSHHHPAEGGWKLARIEGAVFAADHEIWMHLSPGDRLAVFGCVQSAEWSCIGEIAKLQFGEYYDPSVETEGIPPSFRTYNSSVRAETEISVTAYDASIMRRCWMITHPFTEDLIRRISSLRLTTISRHQGWVSLPDQGSWSWFEIAVVSELEEEVSPEAIPIQKLKCRPDGTLLSWESHRHPVDQDGSLHAYRGIVFDRNHELWTHLDHGDRLAVFGCAQFPAWSCKGEMVELEFCEHD